MGIRTKLSSGALVLFFALRVFIVSIPKSSAHPLTIQLSKSKRDKCLEFDIPEGDDARIALVTISDKDTEETFDYYSNMMSELDWDAFKFPPHPLDIQRAFYSIDLRCGVFVKLKRFPSLILRHQPLKFHNGIFFNELAKMGTNRARQEPDTRFELCFNPRSASSDGIRVMFDFMLKSEYEDAKMEEEEKQDRKAKKVIKKHQFTPLENNLQTSVNKANRIVSSMRFMESREARMRETAESTHSRIKHFSYLSIAVMLVVTFFQVVYLKHYFRKKKAL